MASPLSCAEANYDSNRLPPGSTKLALPGTVSVEPWFDSLGSVEPDFSFRTPIQATEETWHMPKSREVCGVHGHSFPIERTCISFESNYYSHPIIPRGESLSSGFGFTSRRQDVSQSSLGSDLLVTGTSLRKSRDLNLSEENHLLYENKQTQKILSTPNVVSMSYTHEVRNGQRTGRKVLQVGVIKKLKKDEIHYPDICIPKEIELSNDLVVPVQVLAEGNLTLHERYKGGAQLTLANSKPGTLGARVEANGSYRLWSCAHVLTDFNEDNIGSEIFVAHHREYDMDNTEYNYEPRYTSKWKVGGHLKIEYKDPMTIVYQDIAWATVSKADLSEEIFGIGPVRVRAMPKVGQTVTIRGGCSGYVRRGTIRNTNSTWIDNENRLWFRKMCYIDTNLGLKKGDSGSAVVHEFEGTKYLVGVYMGASDIGTYFSAAVLPGQDLVADCERRVHDLLCSLPNYQITLDRFIGEYEKMYGSRMDYYSHPNLTSLLESFSSILTISEDNGPSRLVQLKPIHILTHELELLLLNHGGQMAVDHIVPKYERQFERMLVVTDFGFSKLIRALEAMSDTIVLSGDIAFLNKNGFQDAFV